VRLRLIMIPSVIEKFTFGIAMFVLYSQARVHGSDMVFAAIDTLLGILFIIAFLKTPSQLAS
jgi:hypothetical protein